jgi:hypothetical protein
VLKYLPTSSVEVQECPHLSHEIYFDVRFLMTLLFQSVAIIIFYSNMIPHSSAIARQSRDRSFQVH